ncbi:MAG: threonine/serine exporter family protein [Coriobacteriales bacterium]|jgi:uncharacterized membrane protein YjjP (DUF1212 family)|nr:threonine/serine exporter family protein [Coriobacteriales bacterium]
MDREQKKVLLLAMKAGEIMLSSGSEVYRVEDTIDRICHACALPYVECFITTTALTVSLGSPEEDGEIDTVVRRIKNIGVDLERVSQVHAFVRGFSKGEISVDEGFEILQRIERTPVFRLPVRLLGVMLVSFFFTLMSGGSLVDAAFSLLAGTSAYLLSLGIARLKINRFISVFASCFLCAGIAFLCYLTGWVSSMSSMIVGGIIVFLPGVAITNAARDLLSGDMLSGVARVAQSLLTAIAIAGGVGFLLGLVHLGLNADTFTQYLLPLQFLFGMLGTLGISLVVNIPRRYLVPASLISACGYLTITQLLLMGIPHILACFVAACVVALIAEILTHITKEAASLFIVPAIFPLVPGVGLYNTMMSLLRDDLSAAGETGVEAIFIAGSIAVALLVVISLTRVLSAIYNGIFHKNRA